MDFVDSDAAIFVVRFSAAPAAGCDEQQDTYDVEDLSFMDTARDALVKVKPAAAEMLVWFSNSC